jgi:YVTN family beta-propeller protein
LRDARRSGQDRPRTGTGGRGDRTYVFDLTTGPPRQVATVVMKGGGYWMAFSPDGTRRYISERVGNTVAVIDTDSRATVARIAVGDALKRVRLFAPLVG